MSTVSKTAQIKAVTSVPAIKQENAFWKKAETARYGIVPLLLTLVACLGGIAAAFGAGKSIYELSLVVFPTMMFLSFTLAVAPMKLIVWAGAIATLLDLLVFVI